MVMSIFLFLVAAIGRVHVAEHGLAIGSFVERLGCARAVRVLGGVLFVDFRFLFGTLGGALPIAAELVIDEVEVCEIGPARAWIKFDDLLQIVFIHLIAHIWVALLGGRERTEVAFLDLP